LSEGPPGEHPTVLAPDVDLPETFGYRIKRHLLGPPLTTEQLPNERLSKPIALGVLSPDCISSSAYGSEEMLRVLLPFFGAAAFSLLMPVTLVILFVLLLVTLSYREVVMVYTKAGGSYVVARENFGPVVAQIAAVALLIDYTVTVAVQISAGTDALVSAVPAIPTRFIVWICLAVVAVMCWGNLRGIREAGRTFALPTYIFITSMALVIVVGLTREVFFHLPTESLHHSGVIRIGGTSHGILMGLSIFFLLKAFANGGSSLTGLEAISNGVGAFKPPEGRNARRVLVVMSTTLGTLVLGVSWLAHVTHAVPYILGAPTVISQEAKFVFGSGLIGHVLSVVVDFATMLVLYTGGNTSFNGFPFLANFVAGDSFLPRQLTHRGHRLTFSNGILLLASFAFVLLIVTGASVNALVGVYAIGVFTGFTMAGSGMVAHHLRERGPGWRHRAWINGASAVTSFVVVLIFAVTKFTQGAWVVLVLFPVLMYAFVRLHRRYTEEAAALGVITSRMARMPNFHRTVVIVLVDSFDLATVRALRHARSLRPTEIRAVHFMLDSARAARLQEAWSQLPSSDVPLDVVDCPDRRLVRAVLKLTVGLAEEEGTQVTVLLPRRTYSPLLGRLLHDRTADRIAVAVSRVRNAAATIVPFDPSAAIERVARDAGRPLMAQEVPAGAGAGGAPAAAVAEPAGDEPAVAELAGDEPAGDEPAGDDVGATPLGGVDHLTGEVEPGQDPPVVAGQYQTRGRSRIPGRSAGSPGRRPRPQPQRPAAPGCVPISEVRWRERTKVAGQVRSVETRPVSGTPVFDVTLVDETGGLRLLFMGRRSVPGITPGVRLVAEGMVSDYKGKLAIRNPSYQLLLAPGETGPS
jgi:amino acid transporter